MIWSSFFPLYAAQMRSHLNVQFCAPHYKNIELFNKQAEKSKEVVKGVESKSYKEGMSELRLFSMAKRRL